MAPVTRSLTVVMPVYNEAPGVGTVLRELEQRVLAAIPDAELIVVDDASTDGTPLLLRAAAEANDRIRVQTAERNAGHGPSVLHGLDLAEGEWIFQLDSDGQFDVADFWKLWERRSECDLVTGRREARKDPSHRLMLAWTVRRAVRLLGARGVTDANTPLRLMRRELWEDVAPFVRRAPLAPSIMMTVAATIRGWRVVEVPVTHLARRHGRSTLPLMRLALFGARGLVQLVGLRARLSVDGRKPG